MNKTAREMQLVLRLIGRKRIPERDRRGERTHAQDEGRRWRELRGGGVRFMKLQRASRVFLLADRVATCLER